MTVCKQVFLLPAILVGNDGTSWYLQVRFIVWAVEFYVD